MSRPSIQWRLQFLLGYLYGEIAKAPPYAMVVDVTRRCNISCLHCRVHSPIASVPKCEPEAMDVPFDRFRALCAEAKAMGIRKIFLIGEGEPMLHPNILEIVRTAKAAGRTVEILTNGTTLKKNHAAAFVDAGLDELHFTLWATNREEYVALYPGTSSAMFDRTIRGIQFAVEAKRARQRALPKIVLHRPIEPRFFRSIAASLTLAHELQCEAIAFSPVKPLLQPDNKDLFSDAQRDELIALMRKTQVQAKALKIGNNIPAAIQRFQIGRMTWKQTPCYIGWIDVRIRTNGDVVPCDTCNWVMGNIGRNTLREVWNGSAYRKFRRRAKRQANLSEGGHDCCCDFCCHVTTNARVQRILKWIPLERKPYREVVS